VARITPFAADQSRHRRKTKTVLTCTKVLANEEKDGGYAQAGDYLRYARKGHGCGGEGLSTERELSKLNTDRGERWRGR
jgi:hypothetical protein